jgi:hypothetical protein
MISHWDDVPWTAYEHGDLRCERQGLSRPRGSAGATLSRCRIPAGARSMPLHVHVDEEELFVHRADACWFPDARKIGSRALGVAYRVEPLHYWDGEE